MTRTLDLLRQQTLEAIAEYESALVAHYGQDAGPMYFRAAEQPLAIRQLGMRADLARARYRLAYEAAEAARKEETL